MDLFMHNINAPQFSRLTRIFLWSYLTYRLSSLLSVYKHLSCIVSICLFMESFVKRYSVATMEMSLALFPFRLSQDSLDVYTIYLRFELFRDSVYFYSNLAHSTVSFCFYIMIECSQCIRFDYKTYFFPSLPSF